MTLALAALIALQGQSEPPSVGVNYTDGMRSAYSGRPALEVLHQSARCIVGRNRAASTRLIATIPDTLGEWRILYGPIRSRLDQCSMMGVSVTNALLRGAIAEALLETAYPVLPVPAQAVAVAPIAWPRGHRSAPNLAPIYELGRCVVASNPRGVARLLAAEPFSGDESQALRALSPMLEPCLDQGTTFNTNRETLRAVLSESLFRWATAQPRTPTRAE